MGSKTWSSFTSSDTFDGSDVKLRQDGKITLREKRYYDSFAQDADIRNITNYDFNETSYKIALSSTNGAIYVQPGFSCSENWIEYTIIPIAVHRIISMTFLPDGSVLALTDGTNAIVWKADSLFGTYTQKLLISQYLYNVEYADIDGMCYTCGTTTALYSADLGETWTDLTDLYPGKLSRVYRIVKGDNFVYAVGQEASTHYPGAYKSSDGGQTWVDMTPGVAAANSQFVAVLYLGNDNILTYMNGVAPWLHVTSANGTTWTKVTTLSGPPVSWFVLRNGNIIFGKTANPAAAAVYLSIDNGASFSIKLNVSGVSTVSVVNITDEVHIAYLSDLSVYISRDSGATWNLDAGISYPANLSNNDFECPYEAYYPQDIGLNGLDWVDLICKTQISGAWGGKAIEIKDLNRSGSTEVLANSGSQEIEMIFKNVTGNHYIFESSGSYARIDSNIFSFYNNYSAGELVTYTLSAATHHIRVTYNKSVGLMKLYVDGTERDSQTINSTDLDIAHNKIDFISKAGYDAIEISLFKITGLREDYEVNSDLAQTTDYSTDNEAYILRASESLNLVDQKISSVTANILEDTGQIKVLFFDTSESKYYFCNPADSYASTEVAVPDLDVSHSNTISEFNTYADNIINAGHEHIVPVFILKSDGSQRPVVTDLSVSYAVRNTAPEVNAGDTKYTTVNSTIKPYSDCTITDIENNLDYATSVIEATTITIVKGAYASLQAAVRDYEYIFRNYNVTPPFVECTLTAYDTGGLSAQDVVGVIVGQEPIINYYFRTPFKGKLANKTYKGKVSYV